MKIILTQVSPVSFMVASQGDWLRIKKTLPRLGEYRDKIGAPRECFLVFKGKTKIGMIPHDIIDEIHKDYVKERCQIVSIDKHKNIVVVEV